MRITFLNVGHGDCTIIEHASGRLTVIDLNNCLELDRETLKEVSQYYWPRNPTLAEMAYSSGINTSGMVKEAGYNIGLTNPIEFLLQNYPNKNIFRYIQTHPNLDHMSGIEQLKAHQLNVVNFWDTEHNFTPKFFSDADRDSWNEYKRLRGSSNGSPKVLRLHSEATGTFWNKDSEGINGGDGIDILHPNPKTLKAIQESGNINNLSYVLRVTLGTVRIVLAGDAEKDVWDDLVNRYGSDLKCNVLKASHHGRESGFHDEATELM